MFPRASDATYKHSKEIFSRAELQWPIQFKPWVSCLWVFSIYPASPCPCSAFVHPAADLSRPSALPPGPLCGIGAVIRKGTVSLYPRAKSQSLGMSSWAGSVLFLIADVRPKPSQRRGCLQGRFSVIISFEGID